MAQLLVIDSSIRHQGSLSRQLTDRFVACWRERHPADRICRRDLAVEPPRHLDGALLGAWTRPAAQHGRDEREALHRANALTAELLAADVLVLAVPMYNFSIPGTLKAWFDQGLNLGEAFMARGVEAARQRIAELV